MLLGKGDRGIGRVRAVTRFEIDERGRRGERLVFRHRPMIALCNVCVNGPNRAAGGTRVAAAAG